MKKNYSRKPKQILKQFVDQEDLDAAGKYLGVSCYGTLSKGHIFKNHYTKRRRADR